jgi:hypothetical protein
MEEEVRHGLPGLAQRPKFWAFALPGATVKSGANEAGNGSALAISPRTGGDLPLQDGQMFDVGPPTLAVFLAQLLQQVFPKVDLLHGSVNSLAFLLELEIDIRQSLQKGLKQRLQIWRIHSVYRL